ncbi:hypothetical protein ACET3X_004741 [Alternaria dauci]|uniref:C2H2-type domain-containing protein n=1 Tax=Alternaria dauci TaxID=48095 RepID=A0ABR3UI94_9PLEO
MWPSPSFYSPLSGSINRPLSQNDGGRILHYDDPMPQAGPTQQPGAWDSPAEFPFHEPQAPSGPSALQPAWIYGPMHGGMGMGNPCSPGEPTMGVTQASALSMPNSSYGISPSFEALPFQMGAPYSQAAAPFLASPFSPVSQSAEHPDTVELDAAIQHVLQWGTSEADLRCCVERHRSLKDAGIFQNYETMSKASPELLEERLRAIEAALPPNAEAPVRAPSDPSETPNHEPGSLPRNKKLGRRTSQTNARKEGRPKTPRGVTPKSIAKPKTSQGKTSKPKLCPHNNWTCEQRTGQAQWRSRGQLFTHYKEHHLAELRCKGGDGKIRCTFPFCQHGPFPGGGDQFIDHLWYDHMEVPRT